MLLASSFFICYYNDVKYRKLYRRFIMIAANYTNFRANLKSYMDKAKTDYETIVVTSKDGNVVVLSEEEYNNMKENLFIMSNQEMVKRLDKSIKEIVEGKTVTFSFDDLKKLADE